MEEQNNKMEKTNAEQKMNAEPNLVSIADLTFAQVASICDHTFLTRPEVYWKKGVNAPKAYAEAFDKFMQETVQFEFAPYAVCVRPEDVTYAKEYLAKQGKENIVIASVVGFPDGSRYSSDFKVAEAEIVIKRGAKEVDMVINVEKLKQKDFGYVTNDITPVVDVAHRLGGLVKLILETSELSNEDIVNACRIAEKTGVDFVKTSTGFNSAGAQAEPLKLMRENFSKGIKMAGGVNKDNYKELLTAASGRTDGYIELNPLRIRIGESSLLKNLVC